MQRSTVKSIEVVNLATHRTDQVDSITRMRLTCASMSGTVAIAPVSFTAVRTPLHSDRESRNTAGTYLRKATVYKHG